MANSNSTAGSVGRQVLLDDPEFLLEIAERVVRKILEVVVPRGAWLPQKTPSYVHVPYHSFVGSLVVTEKATTARDRP